MLRLFNHGATHRYVISNFVTRDLKVKYRGTLFGYLWSLLEPMSLVAIYYFVFVVIARRGEEDYALLVILGVLPWTFFSSVVMGGANALRTNAGLIRKVRLPREVYVIAGAASAAAILMLSMLSVIPFLLVFRVAPGLSLLLWPVAIVLIAMMAIGVGLIAACANVIYRDVAYLITVVLRIGFYFSAVIYPVTMVPETFRHIFLFNPMALCLSMARSAVMNSPPPYALEHVASAVLVAFVLLGFGTKFFSRWENKAVKFL